MTNNVNFGDVITAMVTPFKSYKDPLVGDPSDPDKDLIVDLPGVERVAKHLLENGTDTILLTGSTGEAAQLSDAERWEILKRVRQSTPNGTKIMVATSTNNTASTIANSKKAFELGADAILVAVPSYIKPSPEALFIYFNAIAKAIDGKPMMIYNIPSRTAREILPETVAKLAEANPNIVGIKQSMPNMDRMTELKKLCPPNFQIYSGDDNLTLPMLALGARGVVSVMSHLEGRMIKEMIANFHGGYLDQALRRHMILHPLFSHVSMGDYANPLPIKEALYQRGLIESPRAKTLGEMSQTCKENMKNMLSQFDKTKKDFYSYDILSARKKDQIR